MPNFRSTAALGLASALALAGCKSVTDLEERPATFISPATFYRNDADAVSAVNGAYQPLMDWNLWRQPAWISVACDDDEMQCQNWMAGGFEGRQAGQWYVSRPWTGDYQIIARANDVIANVGVSTAITPATKKLTAGQALFIRGYAYFDLVRRFGGAPIRLEPYQPSDQAGTAPRASVPEVYAVVVKDLKAAADSLPATYTEAAGGARPTNATAWGMLAKVYLHMAGEEVKGTPLAAARAAYLDSARTFAKRVIDAGSARLEANYMDLFDIAKQNASAEVLFSVQASAAGVQGAELPGFFAPTDYKLAGGGASGFIGMRRDFYKTFAPGDKRVAPNSAVFVRWNYSTSANDPGTPGIWLDSLPAATALKDSVTNYGAWTEQCGEYGQNTHLLLSRSAANPARVDTARYSAAATVYIKKYVDPAGLSKTGNSNNPIVLRYADVLLVYAEAENAASGPANAYAAINQVRARAGLPALSGLSQAEFAEAVYQERKHELYAEFQTRFDMVRLGRWLTDMNKPARDGSSGTTVCRPRQAYQVLFPLPESEIAGNPQITQNPGY